MNSSQQKPALPKSAGKFLQWLLKITQLPNYPITLPRLKVLAVLFAMVLIARTSTAQQITWSPPMEDDRKFPYLKILGEGESGYYLLRSNLTFRDDRTHSGFRSRKYILQLLDESLRVKWSVPLTAGCEDCQVADVGIIGTTPAILYSQFNKPEKRLGLYVQKLNAEGKPYGSPALLMEVLTEKIAEEQQPDLLFSHDESKMAFALRSISKGKQEQLYNVVIFDTALSVLGKKEIEIPIKPRLFGPVNSLLTNDGNFFLLGIEFLTEKRVKNPGESFYKLVSYNLKNDRIALNEIRLEDKFLTDVAISADDLNHNVVVTGFYSLMTTYTTAGVFYYSVNEDSLAQSRVVTSTFSADFLRKLTPDRRGRGNELVNYSIIRNAVRKDGGAAIVAESYSVSTRSYWDYYLRTWVYHYDYTFGNIITLSVNPDGSLLWNNVTVKEQVSTDDGGYYSSFYSAIINGKILSIYNKYISRETSVLLTSISGNGQQDTRTIFQESENVTVVPHSSRQVAEDAILMPVERGRESFIIRLEF